MSRRRFMPEAEELMQRVPSVMYHSGELIAWTLIVLESEGRLDEQASLLKKRSTDFSERLQEFCDCVAAAFENQKEALLPTEDFQVKKKEALQNIKLATTVAEEIEKSSEACGDKRKAQALVLHELVSGKWPRFSLERSRADLESGV